MCLVLTSRSVIGSGGILQIVWTHFCLLFHERYQAVHDLLVTFDRQKTALMCVLPLKRLKLQFLTRWKSSSTWATDIFVFQSYMFYPSFCMILYFSFDYLCTHCTCIIHVHHCHVKVCVWQLNFSLFLLLLSQNKNKYIREPKGLFLCTINIYFKFRQ